MTMLTTAYNRIWMYFIAINVLLIILIALIVIPERIRVFQSLGVNIRLQERQLAIAEQNFLMHEENLFAIAAFETLEEGYGSKTFILPPGYAGALLRDVRGIIYTNGLTEQEFHASEHTSHQVSLGRVTEMRVTVAAAGNYEDIIRFLRELAEHYYHVQFERIQISEEMQLRLVFSIYEEW